MRVINGVLGIFREDVGDSLFGELLKFYPEGRAGTRGQIFDAWLPSDDPRMVAILKELAAAGMRPHTPGLGVKDKRKEFRLACRREYDEADLVAAEFFTLFPEESVDDYRDIDRRTAVPVRYLPSKEDFVRTSSYEFRVLIGDRAYNILKKAKLRGAEFVPVIPLRKRGSNPDDTRGITQIEWSETKRKPWWELRSSLLMPPLSPSMPVTNGLGQPVERGYDKGVACVYEGHFIRQEWRYLREELDEIGPFDVALSKEGDWRHKWIIVSQRFRAVCRENGLETQCIPVRIEK